MVRQQHIVIVGAGIVGLSTAYSLLTRGIRNVTILEQESRRPRPLQFAWLFAPATL